MHGMQVARNPFSKQARQRSRQAAGLSRRHKGIETARPSRSNSPSRSSGGSQRPSDIPVTVDFEGGYSEDDGELAYNIARLLGLGVIGINFEDRVVKGAGLYDIDRQARRIAAIRSVAENKAIGFLINARTDLFL